MLGYTKCHFLGRKGMSCRVSNAQINQFVSNIVLLVSCYFDSCLINYIVPKRNLWVAAGKTLHD